MLAASLEGTYRDRMAADFARADIVEIVRVRLDPKRWRRVELLVGEDFQPKPRQ